MSMSMSMRLKPRDEGLYRTVKWFCEATPQQLYRYADQVFGPGVYHARESFYYSGPRHNVLAVGHTDFIAPRNQSLPLVDGTHMGVRSIALDDRLGIAMLFMLRQFGYEFDLLLTDFEEVGRSTAQAFAVQYAEQLKNYGWIFEIDRRVSSKFAYPVTAQDDLAKRQFRPSVVMYQYHTKSLQAMFEKLGFLVETGSSSDICYLDTASASAFNFCAAYTHEHTDICFALYDDIYVMLGAIGDFIDANKDVKFLRDLEAERASSTLWGDIWTSYRAPSYYVSRPEVADYRGGYVRARTAEAVHVLPRHPGELVLSSRTGYEITTLYGASRVVWSTGDTAPRSPCDVSNESLPGVLRICFESSGNEDGVVGASLSEGVFINSYLT